MYLSVIGVPVANIAEPVLPTATLIPAGLEVTRSPLLPVAVTVTVADCDAGFTDSVAVLGAPPKAPLSVTDVEGFETLDKVSPQPRESRAPVRGVTRVKGAAVTVLDADALDLAVTRLFDRG